LIALIALTMKFLLDTTARVAHISCVLELKLWKEAS